MASMRVIGRLILHDSPHSSLSRWLSTAAGPGPRALFKKVVDASSRNENVVDVMNECVGGGERVSKSDIFNLAAYFRHCKNHRAGLQLCEWLDSSNLRRTWADEARHIHLLGKIKGVASAEKYFHGLKEKSKVTYGAILTCYCKEKVLDKALEIFEKMKESNDIDTRDYNSVITLYHDLKQPAKVVSLVEEMKESNVDPDTYTYNMLLSSHIALKNLDAITIDGVLEEMKDARVKCNRFTYGILANAYLNAGLHEKAAAFLGLVESMKFNKGDAKIGCHIRLKLYSMMNDPARVNRAWEDLKSHVQKPDDDSYHAMLLALSRLSDHENLEKIFKEWEEGCTSYNFRLPNMLLKYYLSLDMMEEANSLYKRLVDGARDRGTEPNGRTLELFAILCLKNCEIDSAMEHFEKALGKLKPQSRWHPKNETIEEFIRYFEEKGDRERGGKFIESMKKQNLVQPECLLSYMKATEEGLNEGEYHSN